MGQYYKGTKIGTCENMYYVRLSQAQKFAEQGENDDDGIKFADMLTDNSTRFRFPFPDEDGRDIAGLFFTDKDHGRHFTLPVQDGVVTEHRDICLSQGEENVNIFVPCPHSKAFRDSGLRSSPIGSQKINIQYKAMRDGEETTLFACARCNNLQRTDRETWEKIKAYAVEHFTMARRHATVSDYERANVGLVAQEDEKLADILALIERI